MHLSQMYGRTKNEGIIIIYLKKNYWKFMFQQSLRAHLEKMHFKWTSNKQRRTRRDKGIVKKRIIPTLYQKPNTDLSEKENNNKDISSNIILNSAITDEELFQQCDDVLNALTDQSTVLV